MCTHVVPSTHHDASRACWSVGVGMAPRRGGGLDGGPTSLGLPSCCGGCNTRSQAQAGSSSPHAVTLHRIVKFPFRRSLTIRQSPRARGWVPGVSGPKCSAEKHVRTPTPATPSRRRCGGFLRCAGVGCPVHCTNTKRWSRCRGQRRCQRERRFDNNGGECVEGKRGEDISPATGGVGSWRTIALDLVCVSAAPTDVARHRQLVCRRSGVGFGSDSKGVRPRSNIRRGSLILSGYVMGIRVASWSSCGDTRSPPGPALSAVNRKQMARAAGRRRSGTNLIPAEASQRGARGGAHDV